MIFYIDLLILFFCSCLSLASSIIIIYLYQFKKKLDTVISYIVLQIQYINFVFALFWILIIVLYETQMDFLTSKAYCYTQGFLITFLSLSSCWWTTYIGWTVDKIVIQNQEISRDYEKLHAFIVMAALAIVSIIPAITEDYSPILLTPNFVCILAQRSDAAGVIEELLLCVIPFTLSLIYMCYVVLKLVKKLKNSPNNSILKIFIRTIIYYPIFQFICWVWWTIQHFLSLFQLHIHTDDVQFIEYYLVSLYGFFTGIFCGYSNYVLHNSSKLFSGRARLTRKAHDSKTSQNTSQQIQDIAKESMAISEQTSEYYENFSQFDQNEASHELQQDILDPRKSINSTRLYSNGSGQ